MISVTRLNGQRFVLNADLIRTVEERPDTTVTLTTGETMVIRESMREVVLRVLEYGRLLRRAIRSDDASFLPPERHLPESGGLRHDQIIGDAPSSKQA